MTSLPSWCQPGDAAAWRHPLLDDPQRLAALRATGLAGSAPEPEYDDLARLAARLCAAPVGLVTLLGADRQWFKARVGTDLDGTPLDQAICTHALAEPELLVIPDLALDPRTARNPLVTEPPHVRFYAGAPLRAPGGETLGTLCVLDVVPRPDGLAPADREALLSLARQAMTLIELRAALAERDGLVAALRAAESRIQAERGQLATMFEAAPSFMALLRGPDHVFELINPAYRRLIGDRDVVGRPVAEALPEATAQGYLDLLDRVFRLGEAHAQSAARYDMPDPEGGPPVELFLDFVYQPIRDAQGRVEGLFVEGSDVSGRVREMRRRQVLADLGERLRGGRGVEGVAHDTAQTIAEALGAIRAGVGLVDPTREVVLMLPNWCVEGVAPVEGEFHFRDFGSYIDDLRRGEAVAIADVRLDPRTAGYAAAFEAIGIRGLLNLPLSVDGAWSMVLFVHHAEPRRWSPEDLALVRQAGDLAESAIGRALAEGRQAVLNREISHRLKNTLAMVQAIATQTLRGVPDQAPVEAFGDRLLALSTAHDILLQSDWQSADLADVAARSLTPFDREGRVTCEGPAVSLGPRAALALALILHELGTNALKYGSLSAPEGRVTLRWGIEASGEDAVLRLRWQERGGPPVVAPAQRGFGSRLIAMGLTGTGGAAACYHPEGVEVDLTASLSDLTLP